MKFKYIGDKSDMKNVYGYDFSWRATVDIPEDDTLAIRKLSNNSHFKVVEEVEVDRPEPVTDTQPEPVKNVSYGIFRVKEDGERYSKPDKVCKSQEEVDAYLAESGLTRDDRLIMEKGE